MPSSFFASDKKRKRPNRPSGDRPARGGSSGGRGRGGPSSSSGGGRGGGGRGGRGGRPGTSRGDDRDEDVSSDDGEGGADGAIDLDTMDFREGRGEAPMSDDELIDANETAGEKRIRLAKSYLARVKEKAEADRLDDNYDAAEIDKELIASRLQQDVAEAQGRIYLFLASHVQEPQSTFLNNSSHIPTSVALTSSYIYLATKRGSIQRYALPSLRKAGKPFGQARPGPSTELTGHTGEILSIAASEDGRWLVSGGRDKVIGVWDVSGEGEPVWRTGMRGHKDAISSVAIPPLSNPSHHILTGSLSRHLALHSLSTLSMIDTFFGHTDSITSLSSMKPTVAVTAGSRDRTCRWWKVEEEQQLVFRAGGRSFERPEQSAASAGAGVAGAAEGANGHAESSMPNGAASVLVGKKADRKGKGREVIEGSVDVVCMLDEQHFVSGGDSGALVLYHTGKKKPVFTLHFAHGIDAPQAEGSQGDPRWITSLASLRGTDLFVSGSWDGQIRIFALSAGLTSFSQVGSIPCGGVINGLQMLALPSDSVDTAAWPAATDAEATGDAAGADAANGQKKNSHKAKEIMLVAAVAKEPRLGRWVRVQDEGVKNGCLVAHIRLDAKGVSMIS